MMWRVQVHIGWGEVLLNLLWSLGVLIAFTAAKLGAPWEWVWLFVPVAVATYVVRNRWLRRQARLLAHGIEYAAAASRVAGPFPGTFWLSDAIEKQAPAIRRQLAAELARQARAREPRRPPAGGGTDG